MKLLGKSAHEAFLGRIESKIDASLANQEKMQEDVDNQKADIAFLRQTSLQLHADLTETNRRLNDMAAKQPALRR